MPTFVITIKTADALYGAIVGALIWICVRRIKRLDVGVRDGLTSLLIMVGGIIFMIGLAQASWHGSLMITFYYAIVCALIFTGGLVSMFWMPRFIPFRRWAMQCIGTLIWNFSERCGINLGRFGPIVFGWMIGSVGTRVDRQ